jgi:hypothetical protein
MAPMEQQLMEAVRTLPPEQQQQVLDFAEFLKTRKITHPTAEQVEGQPMSALEAAGDLVGCLEGGPPDLSVNKKYLEGFGR